MFKFKVPKVDKEQYEAMLNAGFKAYPGRYLNYQKYLKNKYALKPDFMPIKADIENISRCNFACKHCIAHLHKGGRAENLSFEDFKSFINSQYGLIEVKIQGVGEPFLDPNFCDMVKYASDRFIWVRSTTNGSLLHLKENYKRVIQANIGELQVSIDAADEKTFSSIRIGSNFKQICKNCIALNSYENAKSKTRMWAVLQKSNFHQAKDLVRLAKELGFGRVTLSVELRDWQGYEGVSKFTGSERVLAPSQAWFDELENLAKSLNIDLSFWQATTRFSKQEPCFWMFERFLLSSDKFIVPCCTICDPAVKNFGKIDDFNKIWFDGKSVLEFRKAHLSGQIPQICKSCYGE